MIIRDDSIIIFLKRLYANWKYDFASASKRFLVQDQAHDLILPALLKLKIFMMTLYAMVEEYLINFISTSHVLASCPSIGFLCGNIYLDPTENKEKQNEMK